MRKSFLFDDAKNLCLKHCELGINEREVILCFGMSKMTVYNEVTQCENYFKMQFVEFIEFIGRLAYTKYKGSTDLSFGEKIEQLLDDIFPSFGLTRQDVVIEVEEISESDDDY